MYDLLIKNGSVADGTGSQIKTADIAIKGGKIAAVGLVEGPAERVIDARDCIVAPGFIDIHSHTDADILVEPTCQSKITQGITTEVSGNCGYSSAPVLDDAMRERMTHITENHGISEGWTSMGQFLDVLDKHPSAVNFATYVGHSNIRRGVIGGDDREPTSDELEQMCRLTQEAVEQGAFGISTGLIYAPSCFADTPEIIELAKAAASRGGIYASHIRSERNQLVESVEEAITIGREAGIPVQISHHKACGSNNWGKVKETLGLIDEARKQGFDVTCDQYPYLAGATGLSILIPKWAHDGGPDKLLERLRSGERARIAAELRAVADTGSVANDGGWKSVVVSGVATEAGKRYEGKSILEIAGMREADPVDVVIDLLIEEELRVGIIMFSQCEEDVRTVMPHPVTMIGTDASTRALTGPMSAGKPHPRSFGTYPRVLGRYVREDGILSMERAIQKMTSMPAKKLGLTDRGIIKTGAWADIVVFDPDSIIDTATYQNPHQIAKGVKFVLVNGEVSVEDGELTGTLAGRVLRSTHKR